jgi:hypothetical protein
MNRPERDDALLEIGRLTPLGRDYTTMSRQVAGLEVLGLVDRRSHKDA